METAELKTELADLRGRLDRLEGSLRRVHPSGIGGKGLQSSNRSAGTLNKSTARTMQVSARDGWQNTTVHLAQAQEAFITASGMWTTHPDRAAQNDADGFPVPAPDTYYLPGARIGGLIAIVDDGNGNWNKAFIGRSGNIRAAHPGTLYLSANDEPGDPDEDPGRGFYDNAGSLSVVINT